MIRTILADDEMIALKMLKKLIPWEALEMKCIGTAENGLELLDMILDKKPDLVITDIMMPGYNGLEIISKTLEAGLTPQFLITSAYASFEYARTAMRLGVKDFLAKPLDAEELETALRLLTGRMRQPEKQESPASFIIRTARTYINEHYANKLTLEEVAEHAYVSPNYLSSLFKKETGMGFVDYLTQVRLEQSREKLKDRSRSTAEIAKMVGYRDPGYFCSLFMKKYGMSPAAYRKL